MEIYRSYHNTGGTHQVEFARTSKGWFWRMRFFPEEWRGPLTKMKGTVDGTGQMWATFEGEASDKQPYSVSIRLLPIDITTKWDGVKSYPPIEDTRTKVSPYPDGHDPKVSPAREVPRDAGVLTLSDLRDHDEPSGVAETSVRDLPKSIPT